jgi:hypothetical protein
MKQIVRMIIAGAVILAMGLGLGASLNPGSAAAAEVAEGQVQPGLNASMPEQPAASAVLAAGATLYRVFTSFEFRPSHSTLTYATSGVGIYATNLPGSYYFTAPVILPNGVQVTRITFYVVDNNSTENLTFEFYQVNPGTNSQDIIGTAISTSALPTSPNPQSVAMTGSPIATIDSQYGYTLRYDPVITGSGHLLLGARVEYSYPAADYLPYISK